MENAGYIIVIAILSGVIIQLLMIIKFFQIASDIRDMKYMANYAIKRIDKQPSEIRQEEKEKRQELQQKIENDSKKFKWQMWMYIAIVVIILILFFLSK